MIQLNLLPDLKKEFLRAQTARNRVISASVLIVLAALAVTTVAAFYVYGVQNVQIALVNNEITDKSKKLKDVKDINKYLTLQHQLATLPDLHAKKNVYSRLFDYLPTLNPSAPNTVTLVSLQTADSDQTTIFSGTAPNFEAFNVFKDTLVNAKATYTAAGQSTPIETTLFRKVLVQTASLGQSSKGLVVNFTVQTTYNSDVFLASTSGVSVAVPTQTTGNSGSAPGAVFQGGN